MSSGKPQSTDSKREVSKEEFDTNWDRVFASQNYFSYVSNTKNKNDILLVGDTHISKKGKR